MSLGIRILVLVCYVHGIVETLAFRSLFPIRRCPRTQSTTHLCVLQPPYGKGTDIWPETNGKPIKIEDSFPNGIIPDEAQHLLDAVSQEEMDEDTKTSRDRKRDVLPALLKRILRRAKAQQASEATINTANTIDSC